MRTEDGCIIQECLNGEPEAFGVLVDKYKEGIYAFVYARLRNFQDAQDVTQEVFLQAYIGLRSLKRWESFAFWLYRIAYARCGQWRRIRSKRVDREFIEDQDPKALEDFSVDSHRDDQVCESLREALDSLPETYREALMLYYFGGMNSKEIARAIGISPTAVRMRLSRARAQLKEEMVAILGSSSARKKKENTEMDTTAELQRLSAGFTFRVVEAVKRIKIRQIPRLTELPWGLSLASSLIIAVISLSPYLSMSHRMDVSAGAALSREAGIMRMEERFIDVSRSPEISTTSLSDVQSVVLLDSQADEDAQPISDRRVRGKKKENTEKADTPMANSHPSASAGQRQVITIELPGLPERAKRLEMVLLGSPSARKKKENTDIQPGTFRMGSPKEENGRSDSEWLPHEVTITRPFYIGKYEVTQAQWETLVKRNRSKFRGMPDRPVEKVSWRECQKFIKRLNDLGQGAFRLPTEAGWGSACRGGTEPPVSFSDQGDLFRDIAGEYMWWRGNNERNETKEVGLKLPNPWGLHDMHGNVHEWCSDRWELPHARGHQTDPQGPGPGWWRLIPFWINRVSRGGSYNSAAAECRSAHRGYEQSFDYHYSLGFRLVREYP